MGKNIKNPAVDYLFDAILSLKDKDECYAFFDDICTVNEILSLSQRFEVAAMLRSRKTYLEIAEKTGIKYNAKNIYDLIQITEEYAIYEIPVLTSWIGKTIQEVNVRKNYKVNIIVIKNGDRVKNGDTVLVLEAMKMETPIAADRDGVIISVDAAVGAVVAEGDALITIG